MIIKCLECGAENQALQTPQPGKRYRCGKCGAVITFMQTDDTQETPNIRQAELDRTLAREKCNYHRATDAVGTCVNCGRRVCSRCQTIVARKSYCIPCKEELFAAKTENTSGQGKLADIPIEIRGWSWGAFLLNWIWAICNNVWIGLLALIPYVNLVMIIILGIKGNEWAWRNKRWDSIEHFKRTQRTWAKWGIILLIVPLILGILTAVIVPNVGR